VNRDAEEEGQTSGRTGDYTPSTSSPPSQGSGMRVQVICKIFCGCACKILKHLVSLDTWGVGRMFKLILWLLWYRQHNPIIVRWRSLVGCSPWGHWESDKTERLPFHFSLSCIGEGNGNPLQCSCLENPRDGEAWWAAVYGVAQSRTRLKRLSSSNPYLSPIFSPFILLVLFLMMNSSSFSKNDPPSWAFSS